jgi:hypothetical protein
VGEKGLPFPRLRIAKVEDSDGTTGKTDAFGTCILTRPSQVVVLLRQTRADIHQGSGAQAHQDKAGCMTAVYFLLTRPALYLATMGESM